MSVELDIDQLQRMGILVSAGPGQAAVQVMPDGEIRVVLGEGSQVFVPTREEVPALFPEAPAVLPGRRPALPEGQQEGSRLPSVTPSVQPERQRPKSTPVAPVEVDGGRRHVYLERRQLFGLLPSEITVDELTEKEIEGYNKMGYREKPDKLRKHEEEYEAMRGEQFF